ncbi:MAG: hypothetical protein LBL06_04435 [Treponema sp.]|nr:hypothetical protein [Treponema sp.]
MAPDIIELAKNIAASGRCQRRRRDEGAVVSDTGSEHGGERRGVRHGAEARQQCQTRSRGTATGGGVRGIVQRGGSACKASVTVPVGVSGSPFRTKPRVKSSNTLRVWTS